MELWSEVRMWSKVKVCSEWRYNLGIGKVRDDNESTGMTLVIRIELRSRI